MVFSPKNANSPRKRFLMILKKLCSFSPFLFGTFCRIISIARKTCSMKIKHSSLYIPIKHTNLCIKMCIHTLSRKELLFKRCLPAAFQSVTDTYHRSAPLFHANTCQAPEAVHKQ